MKSVQRTNAELAAIAAAQIGAEIERVLGDGHLPPRPSLRVLLEQRMQFSSLSFCDCAAKNVLSNGVEPLGPMKRSQETLPQGLQHLIGRMRMAVSEIERNQKAGVSVRRQ